MISGGHFDITSKKKKIEELEKQINDINFWNDRDCAEKVLKDINELKDTVSKVEYLKNEINTNLEILDLLELDDDETL